MGLNIKKAIKDRGMQVKDVAAKMGISPVSLSYHINGNPTVEVLNRIAAAIGCDVAELFDAPRSLSSGAIICPHCGKPIALHPTAEG